MSHFYKKKNINEEEIAYNALTKLVENPFTVNRILLKLSWVKVESEAVKSLVLEEYECNLHKEGELKFDTVS